VRVIDIGVGANCVYPLIGFAEYGWRFLGVDIDEAALANARMILGKNPEAEAAVELRHQPVWDNIFTGLLRSGENFELSICNPPFHNSPHDVIAVSQRKWNNLNKPGASKGAGPRLNFGGGGTELWCNGGERAFVKNMIEQSAAIPKRVMSTTRSRLTWSNVAAMVWLITFDLSWMMFIRRASSSRLVSAMLVVIHWIDPRSSQFTVSTRSALVLTSPCIPSVYL
jgi:23S rRNA A1618 N6-methylase RlmF